MLVDPLQTPTNWMVVNADQHRRDVPTAPGTTERQATNGWLSPLRAAAQLMRVLLFPRSHQPPAPVPLLTTVWMIVRLALYDRDRQHPLALVEVS